MKKTHLVLPPYWSIILLFLVAGFLGLILSALGIKGMRGDSGVLGILLLCCVPWFWKRFSFDAQGFTYSRCEILRRRILWTQVYQVVHATLGGKRTPRDVVLIILHTAPNYKRITNGDAADGLVFSNLGHIFVLDFANSEQREQVCTYISSAWGVIK